MRNRIFVWRAPGIGMLKLNHGYRRHRTRSFPSLSDKPPTPILDTMRSQEEYGKRANYGSSSHEVEVSLRNDGCSFVWGDTMGNLR